MFIVHMELKRNKIYIFLRLKVKFLHWLITAVLCFEENFLCLGVCFLNHIPSLMVAVTPFIFLTLIWLSGISPLSTVTNLLHVLGKSELVIIKAIPRF